MKKVAQRKKLGEVEVATIEKILEPKVSPKEVTEKGEDAFFPKYGSVLVFDARDTLMALLEETKAALRAYNEKLEQAGLEVRLRAEHAVTIRGRKYYYCGRYVYKRGGGKKGERYVGRFDETVLRNEVGEKWGQFPFPPKNVLEGLKFQVVTSRGRETGAVIIPAELFNEDRIKRLFKDVTWFRLG